MSDTTQKGNEIGNLFEIWTEMAKSFWPDGNKRESHGDSGLKFNFDAPHERDEDDDRYRTYRTWEGSVNNFTSLVSG